jgi:hypothetical protein
VTAGPPNLRADKRGRVRDLTRGDIRKRVRRPDAPKRELSDGENPRQVRVLRKSPVSSVGVRWLRLLLERVAVLERSVVLRWAPVRAEGRC